MDSLDAQCLVTQCAEGHIRIPELWRHDRAGALSCAYDGGERVFTWAAEEVRSMARRWRDSLANRAPEQARSFLAAHQRLEAVASEAGLGPADVMIHDLGRAEVRGVWEDKKIVVVIDRVQAGATSESGSS